MDHQLLVVDSDADFCTRIQKAVQDKAEVFTAQSLQSAIPILDQKQIDLLVLEHTIDELDGFEVYTELQNHSPNQFLPVIFTHQEDISDDRRLYAYQLGCEDIIDKMMETEDIKWKILLRLRLLEQKKQLENQAKIAEAAAFSAMRANSELGIIMQYMESAALLEHPEELANKLILTLKKFELEACVQFRLPAQVLYAGEKCKADSLEGRMLDTAKNKGKIVGNRARVFFNARYLSILVKNMPFQSPDVAGRLRDNLVVLINSTDALLKNIALKQEMAQAKQGNLNEVLAEGKRQLDQAIRMMHEHTEVTTNSFRQMQWSLEDKFLSLGLSEEQEQGILAELEKSCEMIEQTQAQALKIEQTFNAVIHKFTQQMS